MKKILATTYALSLAAVASAQGTQVLNAPMIPSTGGGSGTNVGGMFKNIVMSIKDISLGIYSSLFVIALILFFIGIMKYLLPGKGADDKKEGLRYLGFGLLAMFVMVAVWGIITFMSANLGIGVGGDIPTPGVPTGVRQY